MIKGRSSAILLFVIFSIALISLYASTRAVKNVSTISITRTTEKETVTIIDHQQQHHLLNNIENEQKNEVIVSHQLQQQQHESLNNIENEQKKMITSSSSSQQVSTLSIDKGTTKCDIIQRSSLHSEECKNVHNTGTTSKPLLPPRQLLVTGVGRSGTKFVYVLLRYAGFRVSHDSTNYNRGDNTDGAISWPHAFNDDICPHLYWVFKTPKQKSKHYLHIYHLVRDPLKVIESRWNLGRIISFQQEAKCSTAVDKTKHTLVQTLQHWVLHNTYIESYTAGNLIQLESIDGKLVHQIYNTTKSDNNNNTQQEVVESITLTKTIEEIDEHIRDLKAKKINSGHTKKKKEAVSTWSKFYSLDKNYTIMAQMTAIRYGYTIPPKDLLPETNLMKQVCGFFNLVNQTHKKWDCYLIF